VGERVGAAVVPGADAAASGVAGAAAAIEKDHEAAGSAQGETAYVLAAPGVGTAPYEKELASAHAVSWLASPRATRALLERFGHGPKHRLGQNFLVNDHVIAHICELAAFEPSDVVLEIGPGMGTLTVAMLERVRAVVAIELDAALPQVLAYTCAGAPAPLCLVAGDALKVTPAQVAAALAAAGIEEPPVKLVANLPYQIAATAILAYFETYPSIQHMVVMVQKEVADRIAAVPGTKDYGAYTAKLRLFAQVTGRFEVGPGNFMPAPNVDSAVVRLERRARGTKDGVALTPELREQVARVIDAGFAQRRKTLVNGLTRAGYEKAQVLAALEALGLDARVRAERLTPEAFIALTQALLGRETSNNA
jgi:16S rRNA (adenine1518-N6/adenine1519-N6)-dimethyltransferase